MRKKGEARFIVSPPGSYGFKLLTRRLAELRRRGEIPEYNLGGPTNPDKTQYRVFFRSESDAILAKLRLS